MSYTPTTLVEKPVTLVQPQMESLLTIPDNFPLIVSDSQQSDILNSVQQYNIEDQKLSNIATMGAETEVALHKILDKFLTMIDPKEDAQIYSLVKQLGDTLEQEKLGELADQIMDPKPSAWKRLTSKFTKNDVVGEVWQKLREVAGQKTTRIVGVIANMEKTIKTELDRLGKEINKQEELKNEYSKLFDSFAMDTLYMHGCLEKAKKEFALLETTEPVGSSRLEDFRDKLQALESRTLAVEGSLTALPATQLVIRQLQNAGIGTIQETTTTTSGRFASIKMTLLTINGALITQGVQRLNEQGANLDKNLQGVQSKLMKKVVTTAANAPGVNRLAQAEKLKTIIQDTKELVLIAEEARANNKIAFAETKKIFAASRADLIQLGTVVRPFDQLKA